MKDIRGVTDITDEQLAICWVYSNVWKIPPLFRKQASKNIDLEWTMPESFDNKNTYHHAIFTVLNELVSDNWQMSEWRRMLAMGEDYWPDAERRLFPLHTLEYIP